VATKTPAAAAMVGAQTTTNNKLKAAAAMATETATMTAAAMTMKMKATVVLNSYAKITFLPKRPQQTYEYLRTCGLRGNKNPVYSQARKRHYLKKTVPTCSFAYLRICL
jgi:hypothetical protein